MGICSISYSRVQYLKGHTWLTLKAATSLRHYRLLCIWQEFLSNSKWKSFFFLFFLKENRRFSHREVVRKCQMSKSSVSWRWYMQWAGIVNYSFVQRVPNQILARCFPPVEVISFFIYETILCDIFLALWTLLICITQQFSATVLTLKP